MVRRFRRGSTLIVAMWVCVALAGLVLVMSYAIRIEALAAANRLGQAEAEAALAGAEQYLLAMVAREIASPGSLSDDDMEAREVGGAFFWILRADVEDAQTQAYGLADEAAKIDINTASRTVLMRLPGMTEDVADAIIDWRDEDNVPTGQGAEDDYYLSLPEPYRAKNGPFESVDELLLVKGVTRELLFGYDRDRSGALEQREQEAGGLASLIGSGQDTSLGIFPYITVHGVQATTPPTSTDATERTIVDINNARGNNQLRQILEESMDAARVERVMQLTQANRPFNHVFDFYYRTQLTYDEFSAIVGRLVARPQQGSNQPNVAKVNLNTASRQVLLCLGLEDSEATTVISRRASSTEPEDIAWLVEALPRERVMAVGALVTGVSRVFSGDLVAVSHDGRAFKRCRVIIDGRESTPRIVYRRDLTGSGWPLPAEIREALRSGEVQPLSTRVRLTGGLGS